jgi:hypothetical protein
MERVMLHKDGKTERLIAGRNCTPCWELSCNNAESVDEQMKESVFLLEKNWKGSSG